MPSPRWHSTRRLQPYRSERSGRRDHLTGAIKSLYEGRRSNPSAFYGEYGRKHSEVRAAFTTGVLNAFVPEDLRNTSADEVPFLNSYIVKSGDKRAEEIRAAFEDGMTFALTVKDFEAAGVPIVFDFSTKRSSADVC